MDTTTIPTTTAEAFTAAFDGYLATSLADGLSCNEANALADLLTALGRGDLAGEWIARHARGDQPGDDHHRADTEDDPMSRACEGCDAEPGEPCRPHCLPQP